MTRLALQAQVLDAVDTNMDDAQASEGDNDSTYDDNPYGLPSTYTNNRLMTAVANQILQHLHNLEYLQLH
jgi:hypothetical protein